MSNPCSSECIDVTTVIPPTPVTRQCSIAVDGQGTCPTKDSGFPLVPVLGGAGALGVGSTLLLGSGGSSGSVGLPGIIPPLPGDNPKPPSVPIGDGAFVLPTLLAFVGLFRMKKFRESLDK
jgi:hypothetical protein